MPELRILFGAASALLLAAISANAATATVLDLASVSAESGGLLRVYGSTGDGALGVPVAGGADCDGDGHPDYAMASIQASPSGIARAGIVYLRFGDSRIVGSYDTAIASPDVLEIHGVVVQESAGSEIWVDDVTGDGLGDLLIGRQNFGVSIPRSGTGALSIVIGGPALRSLAATKAPLRLDAPPEGVRVLTIIGAQVLGRFGIWMRTGDVDGDGIADIVVGADQEQYDAARHAGAVYVIRGGAHLDTTATVDLAASATSLLANHVVRITPPPGAAEFHSGATCTIADLDGNGRGEVLFAAALNRAGATLTALGGGPGSAHGVGGSPHGSTYIVWDDNFPSGDWPPSASFRFDNAPGARTEIHGATGNDAFGEELVGGFDFDADGAPDLFVGDISGDLSSTGNRFSAGAATVFFDAGTLRGRTIDMESPDADLRTTNILGAAAGDIAGDTAAAGDFDGDGRDDLLFSAPHHAPLGRVSAGASYVLFGADGGWPPQIDLRDPLPEDLRTTIVYGAAATVGSDTGDTLAYSAATGDLDGDGRLDVITNEMEGNGVAPGTEDDGNLIILSGPLLAGQEYPAACPPVPRAGCETAEPGRTRFHYRTVAGTPERTRLDWRWRSTTATTVDSLGEPVAGEDRYALCLYDSGDPGMRFRSSLRMPPEADCPDSGCWRRSGTNVLRYRQRTGLPDGVVRAVVRSGPSGLAKAEVRARGAGVLLDEASEFPLVVQLTRFGSNGAACVESRFLAPVVNGTDRILARDR